MSTNSIKSEIKIAFDNAAFEKMSRAEKRVKIAKDVIAMLDAKAIIAHAGSYFLIDTGPGDDDGGALYSQDNTSVCSIVHSDFRCRACALGSMLAAVACEKGDLSTDGFGFERTQFADTLADFFDRDQLELIENAFETTSIETDGDEEASEAAIAWAEQFGSDRADDEDSDARLRAIMCNIIDNGGTFVVPKVA